MSKKLLLCWGTLVGGLLVWWFMPQKHKQKIRAHIYDGIERTSLSIITKLVLNRCIQKIVGMLF